MLKKQNLNDSTTSSTTDDSSHKKKNVKYINLSSLTLKEKIILFTKNKYFKIYTFLITIIILILGDIHKILPIKADLYFLIIHSIFASFIFIEIILYFVAIESYGFSFYFFIDIIFLISIIFEITNVYESVLYKEGENYLKTNMDTIYFINIMKIVRIIRVIRIGKIVTMFNYVFLEKKYDDFENGNFGEENENISTTFVNFSSYKIFLFYVLLIISQIIFEQNLYIENPIFDKNYAMNLFSNSNDDNNISKLLIFTTFIETYSKLKESLIYAKIDRFTYINDSFNEKLRKYELLIYHQENKTDQNEASPLLRYISENNNNEIDLINKELLKKYFNNNEELEKAISNNNNSLARILMTEKQNKIFNFINETNMKTCIEKENNLLNLNLIPSQEARRDINIIVIDNRNYSRRYHFLNLIRTFFSVSIFLFIYLLFLSDINNVILSSIEKMV